MRVSLCVLMGIVGVGLVAGSASARDWYGPPLKAKKIQYKSKGDSILRDSALDLGEFTDVDGDAATADGRVHDSLGDGVFHSFIATTVIGDPNTNGCTGGQEPFVGIDLFDGASGSGSIMYRGGSSLRGLFFGLQGCQDPITLNGASAYSLLVFDGTGRFQGAEGLIQCKQYNTGMIGVIAATFECEGELTLGNRY